MRSVPILTYHSTNVDGNDYGNNDHVALIQDLRQIDSLGYRVVPLTDVVDAFMRGAALPDRPVAIALDDGTDLDYRDRLHPTHGPQRGMLNILRDFIDEYGQQRQPGLHPTAFVIASRGARDELDRKSMIGAGWWGDDWWRAAVDTGLIGIANHSWDHNHAVLANPLGPPGGDIPADRYSGLSRPRNPAGEILYQRDPAERRGESFRVSIRGVERLPRQRVLSTG